MGIGCFCKNSNYIGDINLDSPPKKKIINRQTGNIISKEEEEVEKDENKINKLLFYFNESEKEILGNLKKKEKQKKNLENKKLIQKFDTLIKKNNEQYGIIIERLLIQKNFKICGPKRRQTIINGEKIKIMVDEILKENKDDIKNNKKLKENSVIIKNSVNKKGRFSVDIGIITNGFAQNKKK